MSIEFIGFLPILLVLALGAVQLGIAAYAASQAGTAARAAARMGSLDDPPSDPAAAGRQAMSGWLAERAQVEPSTGEDEVHVTVTVEIPSLFPGIGFGSVTRDATMPRGEEP
ncbi:TadE family protein [Streptomyces sp. NPDC051940]|uniref:TadE family protein n=1 Tax=Streptomyces sp. NPDC051940 TaxID=3155675 RepID=UPI00342265EA